MFSKLRNKFIILNLGLAALILTISFIFIYSFSIHSADKRPPIPDNAPTYSTEVRNIVDFSIKTEKQNAARELLTMLITVGFAIELIVGIASYFLAEEFIRPVKNAYESQKIFIANASHEIKTPLAAISANLEAADIKNNKWINNIQTETEKLTALNSGLLSLARSDLISETKDFKIINLKKVIDDNIKLFTPRLKQSHKKIILSKKCRFNGDFKANLADLNEILSILIDNAIKYSESKIIISYENHILYVKNDGNLIPKESLPHIFERFYQADKTAEGVGLGLAIAKSLADRNNWKLAANTSEKYNIFSISL